MSQTQRLDVRELINTNPLSRYQKLVIFLGVLRHCTGRIRYRHHGLYRPHAEAGMGASATMNSAL
ncbi:Uncharacterised protein [Kluyvera cryocrescens]|uniref:Uncharacterized protein n=1 Tax=Kluyvera cryocrescens TaxID=580 RepID=A0A485CZB4_KLUCR|nr:Uncharacterised protein [Kluyvera cryocrescens]